jgi:hypothetical protein
MQVANNAATRDQMRADALHRHFSSPVQPTPSYAHNNSQASNIAHQAQAQQAINAFDAVMGNSSHLGGDQKENSGRR